MAITKNIEIDGRLVPFKASATVPRLYRLKFGRDIFSDIDKLIEATQGGDAEASALTIESLTIFEDVAYTMAKYADDSIPDTTEEWLDVLHTAADRGAVAAEQSDGGGEQKKTRATDRPMTTPLFLLRCLQIGLSLRDLDLVTVGMVIDMATERGNDDSGAYVEIATQEDFDKF